MKRVYTVTFGDVAENHARMQKVGVLAKNGYSVEKVAALADELTAKGLKCEIVDLSNHWSGEGDVEKATVLVIRKGVQHIIQNENTKVLMREHDQLAKDKKALMRGKVVNKHARWNLCFAEEDQEPDYEAGKGRIVAYKHIPLTQLVRERVAEWMEDGLLNGEANYYYDMTKCGIGFHGDAERKKVVAMRMGESMPLYFQWFQQSQAVGGKVKIDLHDGDMYVMSAKSVGFDWLKKIEPTLRHATGCSKFTTIVPKPVKKMKEAKHDVMWKLRGFASKKEFNECQVLGLESKEQYDGHKSLEYAMKLDRVRNEGTDQSKQRVNEKLPSKTKDGILSPTASGKRARVTSQEEGLLGKEDLVRFKRKIKKYLKGGDTYTVNDVKDFLTSMQQQQASYLDLEETGIALTINKLRTESTAPELQRTAKLVLKKWKRQMKDDQKKCKS